MEKRAGLTPSGNMKSSKGKTPLNGGPAKSRRPGGQGSKKQRERDPVVKDSELYICPVCEEVIRDATETTEGQASVFCSGVCSTWLHRQCAGLSVQAFRLLDQSVEPYFCPNCKISSQNAEIGNLKREIMDLRSMLTNLEAKIDSSSQAISSTRPVSSTDVESIPLSYADVLKSTLSASAPQQQKVNDRKYNIVLYGINESPEGTRRHDRDTNDYQSVVDVVRATDSSLGHNSVRDCFRLGRYSKANNRPILVKFACARSVTSVLSNRKNLSKSQKYSKVSIKKDMSKKERQEESLLLKERLTLINPGTLRRDIKIRGNRLLVKNRVVGSVINSKYVADSSDSPPARSPSDDTSHLSPQTITKSHGSPVINTTHTDDNPSCSDQSKASQ